MIINAIVAVSLNGVIGVGGALPFKQANDMLLFKTLTTKHAVIMGRKTYESIGKPLPNRTNIVVSRNKDYEAPGCFVVGSINDGLQLAKTLKAKECFLIGGAEIYKEGLQYCEFVYVNYICCKIKGDTFFAIDNNNFRQITHTCFNADSKNEFATVFTSYQKILCDTF